MTRRAVVLVAVAFALTRLGSAWLADHPDAYGGGAGVVGDPTLYRLWATEILERGGVPYTDVRIEYPPGSLPFVVAPALLPGLGYRSGLIAVMLLLDVAGLIAVLRLASRDGSMLGPWLWTVLIPLLGPIAYLRLDLVPAVATLWALERASARGWFGEGAWLGFATVAKLYPVVLIPVAFVASPRRRLFLAGAGLVVAAALLPFAATPRGLFQSVLGYHLERGVEVESLWGGVLLLAGVAGHGIGFRFDFLSLNVTSPISPALKVAAAVLATAAVVAAVWLAVRMPGRVRRRHLAALLFGTLTAVVAVSTVLSPQYLLWLIPLAAAAGCDPDSPVRTHLLLLAPACLLTQWLFPFLFERLPAAEPLPLAVLWARNLLLLGIGVATLLRLRRVGRPS